MTEFTAIQYVRRLLNSKNITQRLFSVASLWGQRLKSFYPWCPMNYLWCVCTGLSGRPWLPLLNSWFHMGCISQPGTVIIMPWAQWEYKASLRLSWPPFSSSAKAKRSSLYAERVCVCANVCMCVRPCISRHFSQWVRVCTELAVQLEWSGFKMTKSSWEPFCCCSFALEEQLLISCLARFAVVCLVFH